MALRGVAVRYYSYSFNSAEMPMHLNCAAYSGLYSAFLPVCFLGIKRNLSTHSIGLLLLPIKYGRS